MNEADLLDRFLKLAEKGGALSASAVLFLACVGLVLYLIWDRKNQHKAEMERNGVNERSIEARVAMVQAVSAMAEKTENLTERVDMLEAVTKEIKTLIDERLPRRA